MMTIKLKQLYYENNFDHGFLSDQKAQLLPWIGVKEGIVLICVGITLN